MFDLKSSEFQPSILTTSFFPINTLKYLDLLHYLLEWIMGGKYEPKTFTCDRHLSMKPFVLFCHREISQTMALHAMLLVFLGSS
jgi:hypothetical protein